MMKKIFVLIIALQLNAAYSNQLIDSMLEQYKMKIQQPLSEDAGKKLWMSQQNGRSCTSCHTDSVAQWGKHKKTGKLIKPMAPSVNSERFSSRRKINKWFLRNCKWTFKRECTNKEKADILLWLSRQ